LPIAVFLVLASLAVPAQEEGALPDFPVRSRPAFFDEERSPVGSFQTPRVAATPTDLEATELLTFTVRITAAGPVVRPPGRPRLEDFPDFRRQFYIEPDGAGDGRIDERTWEFSYRLRPRNEQVKEIPSFPFVFFVPGLLPPEKGYQTRRTEAVPLTVRPQTAVAPSAVQGLPPPRGPDSVYLLAQADEVLRWPAGSPGVGLIALLLATPPLLCLGWYLVWQRLYPSAAWLARRRRSQAGRSALRALQAIHQKEAAARAGQAVTVMAEYLRQRFDLPGTAPTPADVAAHLGRVGVLDGLAGRAAEFFRACDGIRFTPPPRPDEPDPIAAAERLLFALEEMGETAPHLAGGVLVLGLLVGSALPLADLPDAELVARAEAAFRQGERLVEVSPEKARQAFRESAQWFEAVREQGYANAALDRNEGNARLLGGDVGRAVFAYRRGLRLAPGDRALRDNLAYARSRVLHPTPDDFARPSIDHRLSWPPHLTVWELLGLMAGAYGLGCVAFTRWRMTRRRAWLTLGGAALAVAMGMGAVGAYGAARDRVEARHPLVVIAEDGVLLYKGNGFAYPHHETPLNAGVEARLCFVRGDWLQIELGSGEVGWVPERYALVDWP
jgi:hypothetical protein